MVFTQQLLAVEDSATRAMHSLRGDETARGVTEDSLQIALPYLKSGGIRSTHLVRRSNSLIWKWC